MHLIELYCWEVIKMKIKIVICITMVLVFSLFFPVSGEARIYDKEAIIAGEVFSLGNKIPLVSDVEANVINIEGEAINYSIEHIRSEEFEVYNDKKILVTEHEVIYDNEIDELCEREKEQVRYSIFLSRGDEYQLLETWQTIKGTFIYGQIRTFKEAGELFLHVSRLMSGTGGFDDSLFYHISPENKIEEVKAIEEVTDLDNSVAVKLAMRLNAEGEEAYNKGGSHYPAAVSKFRSAVKYNKFYAQAYSNLGFALRKVGNLDKAIEKSRRAICLTDKDSLKAVSYYNIARVYEEKGDQESALENFSKAYKYEPKEEYLQGKERIRKLYEKD